VTTTAELGPDDRAQRLRSGTKEAAFYRHRVEFHRDGKVVAARRFEEGIFPPEPLAPGQKALLVCTSAEWAVAPSTAAERGFCGALDLDGKELFRLEEAEESGISREPIGLRDGGREALFALTRARKQGREVAGYRLWRKGKPSELLPPDGPRTRAVLEEYEGRLVLPGPAEGN
jgi:hypothetical protein